MAEADAGSPLDQDDLAALQIKLTQTDAGWVARMETSADDGAHWACTSDPRPTRVAAVFQCLAIGIANAELD